MKKLNLKNLKLATNDLLHRDQLKEVFGGYTGAAACALKCNNGVWIHNAPDPCPSTGDRACQGNGGFSGAWQCTGPIPTC